MDPTPETVGAASPGGSFELSFGRRALFIGLLYLCLLLALEVVFHLAAWVSPRWAMAPVAPTVPDPILGTRPNPEAPDHDAAGWRNARVPDRAPIVAIGDSQTYGHTVARSNAWPQRLEMETGIPVYNMALGGYNAVQYLLLIDEALRLSPEIVFVGIYAGNDLAGTYSAVYREGLGPDLRSRDPQVLATIEALEASGPPVHEAWQRTQQSRKDWRVWTAPVLDPLRQHSALWGLARAAWGRLTAGPRGMQTDLVRDDWHAYRAIAEQAGPSLLLPVDDGRVRTVLTPSSWLMTLDQGDARIAEGARLVIEALDRMQDACAGRCELVPVFIPTKELVLAHLDGEGAPPELAEMRRWEEHWWAQLATHLEKRGMRWVDTLPRLRAVVARGENPFYIDWNGHLNVLGNQVVASAVAASEPLRSWRERGPAETGEGGVR